MVPDDISTIRGAFQFPNNLEALKETNQDSANLKTLKRTIDDKALPNTLACAIDESTVEIANEASNDRPALFGALDRQTLAHSKQFAKHSQAVEGTRQALDECKTVTRPHILTHRDQPNAIAHTKAHPATQAWLADASRRPWFRVRC
jgi:hypothetical protein